MSIEQLAARADTVVRGRVGSRSSAWRGELIYTTSHFEVTEVLKGRPPARLRVVQLGGVVDDRAQPVPGVAELRTGQEVVLFLLRDPRRPGEYQVAGMSQGALHVVDDGTLLWAPRAALWDGERLRPPSTRRVSWDQLRRALRGGR